MNNGYELIIFDWDGTLMNSLDRIVSCMQKAAVDAGLPVLESDAIQNIVGLELGIAIIHLYPLLGSDDVAYMRERYSFHYVQEDKQPSAFYPGVPLMLENLLGAGKTLSIATGKSRRGLDRVLGSTGMGHLFESSRCADESDSKPHPTMVNELLVAHDIAASKAVVIGDTSYDMEMAKNAGVDRIGVTWGAHSVECLTSFDPISCVDSVLDLTNALLGRC